MSVTALDVPIKQENYFAEEVAMLPVESPAEAIDLVFEELDLDPRTYTSRLDRDTVVPLIGVLRRGYGCCEEELPAGLSALATMARLDPEFSVHTGVFIDQLWELRQEFPEDLDD